MAKEKGKNIVTAPPMNSSSRSWAFGEPHGCDGNGHGCASDMETWPLHHVYRRGERCRLCSSCILLAHRSFYCCCCFFLVTPPSTHYDDSDPLRAPPAPTVTCQVCRDAVAHVACLYPADGVFVCPACRAAEERRPFTYAPPCRVPLDPRDARVLVLAARMALKLLQRQASAARAEAERLSQVAVDARRRAYRALGVAFELDIPEPDWYYDPHRVVSPQDPAQEEGSEANIVDAPQSPRDQDHLAASEEGIQANMEDVMPPLAALTIGTGGATAVAMAPASSSHTPRLSWPLPPFGANQMTLTAAGSSSSRASPTPPPPPPPSPAHPPPPPPSPSPSPPRALNFFGVREMAMAAAEAARASPPTPRTLQLFPVGEASGSSSKMPRAMQLYQDGIPDEDEEM